MTALELCHLVGVMLFIIQGCVIVLGTIFGDSTNNDMGVFLLGCWFTAVTGYAGWYLLMGVK